MNELKVHPALFAWYVNDEQFSFYHKDIRNMTLTIHELDPNHPSYSVIMPFGEIPTLLNTTDLFGVDNYPIGGGEIREITDLNGKESEEPLGKPYIPMMQIFDWHISNGTKSGNLTPPTVQEMRNMCWQALALGARGFSFYSLFEINLLDNITPIKDRWKDIVEITDQLWEYKDIILSIDKVNKIKYVQNNNVTFRQWKYNNSNYIAVNNLERRKEIFKIDLLDKYEISKQFGLGTFEKNGTEIIFNLEPIDVIMIKNSKSSSSSKTNYLLIIFIILIIIMIFIALAIFFAKRYFVKNEKRKHS